MPEDVMPNWWLIWAEHLARVLAEWWARARATDRGDDSRNVEDWAPPPDDEG
jgi:hypothetical protein